MKNLIITFVTILLSCGWSTAQSTLEVSIKDCREEDRFEYLNEFKLYRNGKLVRAIEPGHESKQTLKKLEYGDYRLEYETMYGKVEQVKLTLSEKKKYYVDLCINYFDYASDTYQACIDQLKDGESYAIQIVSQGCFHGSDETIEIKKESGKFYALFEGDEKRLNADQIKAIRHFEMELNYMNVAGCTTVDTYVVTYKDKQVYISDGGCSWSGGYYLKNRLNLN